MSNEVGRKVKASTRSARSGLRAAGRVAIWAVIALLLVRGLGAVLAPAQVSGPAVASRGGNTDPATAAFAVRFARAYLDGSARQALAPFLADGARVGVGTSRPPAPARRSPRPRSRQSHELGGGRAIVTVACELARRAHPLPRRPDRPREARARWRLRVRPRWSPAPAGAGVERRAAPAARRPRRRRDRRAGGGVPARLLSALEPRATSPTCWRRARRSTPLGRAA